MAQESKQNDSELGKGKITTLEHNCYKQFLDQYSRKVGNYDIKVPFQGHYIGPIEFTRTNDRGRAWIAKENIPKGTLLLAEKAYIFSSRKHNKFADEYLNHLKQSNSNNNTGNSNSNRNDKMDINEELVFDETVSLVAKLIDLLLTNDNPSSIVKDLKPLYPRETEMEDFEPFHLSDFDIESKQDVWLFNHYMLKLENYLSHDEHMSGLKKFDIRMNDRGHFIKRIPWIIYYNAMVIEQNVELLCYNKLFNNFIGDGLYIKSSFFNHNCIPNCIRIFIGDICIVRTIKDIKIKEECCFSYIANEYLSENYRIRNFQLPFECLCNKCIEQRTQSHTNTNTDNNTNNNNNNSNDSNIECKDNLIMTPTNGSNGSNGSSSRERVESDYDSEAEGQEMINYEEHRIFTNNITLKLFSINNIKERINEINKLLGILNDSNKNKSISEIEFSIKSRNNLNFLNAGNNNNNNNNNNNKNGIVHRDFLEGYTAKAMSFLELNEYELAKYSWDLCKNDIKKVQGEYSENLIVYTVQCLLCYLAMSNNKNNDKNNNDNNNKIELEENEINSLKNILDIHQVCFGSDFRLFRMRYDFEINNSNYPKEVKEMFWSFVESNL